MHVLTKIFIVLVSLLAVLLVPLVVVYAYNENSYQSRYQQAEDQAASSAQALQSAQASFGSEKERLNVQIGQLSNENVGLRQQVDQGTREGMELQRRLAAAEANNATIDAKLATLSSAVEAAQRLTESLIEELRGVRKDALAAERQKVELDEALRDALAKLDVAVEARRALEEELQRRSEAVGEALNTIALYKQRYGDLEVEVAAGAVVDRELTANVLNVRRSIDNQTGREQTLAEIDAGSRDHVKEGWTLTIARGGRFVARLRIIEVDINRAIGIVELESREGFKTQAGDQVYASPGR